MGLTTTGVSALRAPAADASPSTRVAAARPIRVMIVDDSAVARAVLSRMVAGERDFDVVADAANADQALAALATTLVDIVTLDVEMPGTDGLTALPRILAAGRGARVIMVSSIAEDGAAATVQALALGAADTIPKPGGGRPHGGFSAALLAKMRTIGHARREEERSAPPMVDARMDGVRLRSMSASAIRCLAIGASTGGLHALGLLFGALPARIGVPILVTQHLPAVFMPFFARQLTALTGRDAAVAEDGTELAPDRILIAPGDAHLGVRGFGERVVVGLDGGGPVGGCLPAVDPMFASVAGQYGSGAVGVVLTGMGRDGLAGSAAIAGAGGTVMVQDAASSAVWGMPRSVAEAGHASAVLDPATIGRRIGARAGTSRIGDMSWK